MTPLLAQRPRTDRSFERLYKRHVGDVYRYALAVLRNPADAEDVTQTTFMNAYRAFQRGDRPETPHNWLIAIAHNVCRQRFRQSARRPQEVAYDDDVAAGTVHDDEAPTAEDIQRALGHLAFNQRAALVMRELEGRSYGEIAEILEVSVSAVETLIFRARRALREQLEGSLTCGEAELAISKQLDGRLARAEKGQLRAHLRECDDCATFARRQRAQRAALKSIAAVPLPGSLASFFGGGGGATLIGGTAVKIAAVAAAGAVVAGSGYEASRHVISHRPPMDPAPAVHVQVRPPTPLHAPASLSGKARPSRLSPVEPAAKPGRHAAHQTSVAAQPAHPAKPAHPAQAQGPRTKPSHPNRGHGATHGRNGSPHRNGTTHTRKRHGNGGRARSHTGNGNGHGNGDGNGSGGGNGAAHGHGSSPSPTQAVTNAVPTVTVPDIRDVPLPKPPKK